LKGDNGSAMQEVSPTNPQLGRTPFDSDVAWPPEPAPVIRILLIEDDAGDAYLVRDLLAMGPDPHELTWVQDMAEASRVLTSTFDCALLDLGLPDSQGLEALHTLLELSPGLAVVVLTGLEDQPRGAQALERGAQDYLTKGSVTSETLARSLRYAIARRRGEDATQRLREAELTRAENSRLERGLLARPILHDDAIRWATRYRPGGSRALLGGDFFDAIELEDGSIRAVVGDVCGHGPDEAALGVALRVAWRALVLAGQSPDVTLAALHRVVEAERQQDHIFATVCDIELHPGREQAQMYLAGHPSPLLLADGDVFELQVDARGPLLGIFDDSKWPVNRVNLGPEWTLVLFTDGIIEGRNQVGDSERFKTTGLARLARTSLQETRDLESLADKLILGAEQANGAPLRDDVALLLLSNSTHWLR
jgi:serine phosphatase RsbU (regulator of sigma subunit)